jgi:hypothetical protein
MKRLMVLLAVFLFVSPAMAAKKDKKALSKAEESTVAAGEQAFNPHWVVQLQGGPDFLLSSTPSEVMGQGITFGNPGWGYNVSAGYAFSRMFSLSFLAGYQVSGVTAQNMPSDITFGLSYASIQLVPQYYFSIGDTRVYGFLGVGLVVNNYNQTTTGKDSPVTGLSMYDNVNIPETDFLLSPGVGAAFKLCDKADLFVQAKLDMDFFSKTYADWMNTMVTGNKFESTQMFLPIQVGVNYSIY